MHIAPRVLGHHTILGHWGCPCARLPQTIQARLNADGLGWCLLVPHLHKGGGQTGDSATSARVHGCSLASMAVCCQIATRSLWVQAHARLLLLHGLSSRHVEVKCSDASSHGSPPRPVSDCDRPPHLVIHSPISFRRSPHHLQMLEAGSQQAPWCRACAPPWLAAPLAAPPCLLAANALCTPPAAIRQCAGSDSVHTARCAGQREAIGATAMCSTM